MDFVMSIPFLATNKSAIRTIVDRLTKSAHFLRMLYTWNVKRLAQLYVKEIARLHRISINIVSFRDQRFQARFLQVLQKAFGKKLNFKQMGKLKE